LLLTSRHIVRVQDDREQEVKEEGNEIDLHLDKIEEDQGEEEGDKAVQDLHLVRIDEVKDEDEGNDDMEDEE